MQSYYGTIRGQGVKKNLLGQKKDFIKKIKLLRLKLDFDATKRNISSNELRIAESCERLGEIKKEDTLVNINKMLGEIKKEKENLNDDNTKNKIDEIRGNFDKEKIKLNIKIMKLKDKNDDLKLDEAIKEIDFIKYLKTFPAKKLKHLKSFEMPPKAERIYQSGY